MSRELRDRSWMVFPKKINLKIPACKGSSAASIAEDTKIQIRTEFVKYEWLIILLQNNRKGFVCERRNKEEAFGIGFCLLCPVKWEAFKI